MNAEMSKGNILWKAILMGSSMVAYFIGAGFASGQEVMQFYVAYGSKFMWSVAGAALLIVWTSISYAKAGHENNFKESQDVFYHYCGKHLGNFFGIFNAINCYASFFFMTATASIVANETFGVSKIVGAIILAIMVILTVIKGFENLVKIMGYLGVFNIVAIIIITAYTLVTNWHNIPDGIALVDSGNSGVTRSAFDNPIIAGFAHIGATILWFSTFVSQLGARYPRSVSKLGAVIGGVLPVVMCVFSALAMFSVLPEVATADVPNLVMASRITPLASQIFTIIIILEVYNTSCPLIWNTASRIEPDEKSNKFKITTIILVVVGTTVAMLVPFKTLLGIIISFGGIICYLLFIAVVVKDVRTFISNKKNKGSGNVKN